MEQSGAKPNRLGNKYSSGFAGEVQNHAKLCKRPFSDFESSAFNHSATLPVALIQCLADFLTEAIS